MIVIIAITVAAVAFFGGMQYQKTQVAATSTTSGKFAQDGQGGQNGQGRLGGRRGGFGGATIGDVVSVDATSVTIKLQDGSSKIVNISGKTTISKTATAAQTDLKTGERVATFGATNSDGSITAQNIQINPMMRNGGTRPSAMPQPSQAGY